MTIRGVTPPSAEYHGGPGTKPDRRLSSTARNPAAKTITLGWFPPTRQEPSAVSSGTAKSPTDVNTQSRSGMNFVLGRAAVKRKKGKCK